MVARVGEDRKRGQEKDKRDQYARAADRKRGREKDKRDQNARAARQENPRYMQTGENHRK